MWGDTRYHSNTITSLTSGITLIMTIIMTKTKIVNLYKEPYDIYIGRAGRGNNGYFGNPIRIGYKCSECNLIHYDNGSTLNCYEKYLVRRLRTDYEFRKRFKQLKNKTLGCFCKPKPCHGDIIIKYLELDKHW